MSDHARVRVSAEARSEVLELGWETTLADLRTRACEALALDGSGLALYCADGTTMENKLQRTLAELRERRMCPRLEFELRLDE